VAAVEKAVVDWRDFGVLAVSPLLEQAEVVRRDIARLVGAQADEVAFVKNTTQGLLIVANGVDWRPGDNIVAAETEFTANVYPWLFLQCRGVEVRFTPAHDHRIDPAEVAALIDARTRLVALSFVEFSSGFRNDLSAIGALCRERGVWFSVDGMQGVGALALDAPSAQIDFLSVGGPKWMMGPPGTGFFYCRRERLEQLLPAMCGWASVRDRDNYYCYDSPLRPDARRFEESTLNLPGIVGLGASVRTLLEVGPVEVERRIRSLTDRLIDGLDQCGCEIISPRASWHERSGIVSFRDPKAPTAEVQARMRANNVITSQRGDYIRVSPHFYNTEADIDRLLDTLNHLEPI
jgi:selenocysteine lyase/cysteine desulfurase